MTKALFRSLLICFWIWSSHLLAEDGPSVSGGADPRANEFVRLVNDIYIWLLEEEDSLGSLQLIVGEDFQLEQLAVLMTDMQLSLQDTLPDQETEQNFQPKPMIQFPHPEDNQSDEPCRYPIRDANNNPKLASYHVNERVICVDGLAWEKYQAEGNQDYLYSVVLSETFGLLLKGHKRAEVVAFAWKHRYQIKRHAENLHISTFLRDLDSFSDEELIRFMNTSNRTARDKIRQLIGKRRIIEAIILLEPERSLGFPTKYIWPRRHSDFQPPKDYPATLDKRMTLISEELSSAGDCTSAKALANIAHPAAIAKLKRALSFQNTSPALKHKRDEIPIDQRIVLFDLGFDYNNRRTPLPSHIINGAYDSEQAPLTPRSVYCIARALMKEWYSPVPYLLPVINSWKQHLQLQGLKEIVDELERHKRKSRLIRTSTPSLSLFKSLRMMALRALDEGFEIDEDYYKATMIKYNMLQGHPDPLIPPLNMESGVAHWQDIESIEDLTSLYGESVQLSEDFSIEDLNNIGRQTSAELKEHLYRILSLTRPFTCEPYNSCDHFRLSNTFHDSLFGP